LEFRNDGFSGGRKTGAPGEKPLGARRESTTNSTHMASGQNRTRATLMGGELPMQYMSIILFYCLFICAYGISRYITISMVTLPVSMAFTKVG